MKRIREDYYKWIWAAVFIITGILCFTLFHDVYLNWGFTRYAINYLDGKTNTVLALTGAATSASVAITLIPGDVGTPIADKLADISSYSIIVLAAVHLEKYLMTLAAVISLKILMPVSMLFAALNVTWLYNPALKNLLRKVCTFALVLVFVVPTSVALSTLVENTYKEDMELSIEETQKEADEIKNNLEGQDQSLWNQFVNTFNGGTAEVISKFENSLNNFIEAISVMLITSCAIPLVTFMVLMWLIKAVLQVDLRAPSLPQIAEHTRINPHQITGGRNNGTKEIE